MEISTMKVELFPIKKRYISSILVGREGWLPGKLHEVFFASLQAAGFEIEELQSKAECLSVKPRGCTFCWAKVRFSSVDRVAV